MLAAMLSFVLLAMPAAEKVTAVVDFRGGSAREAFEKLSEAMHERVVIARQVDPALLDREIRFHSEHLSPAQTVRWVARLCGLEAVHTRDGYYVASRGHLKALAVAAEGGDTVLLARASTTRPSDLAATTLSIRPELRELMLRRSAVLWQDTPLTRAAGDISRSFGIDVIPHPDVLALDTLLEWERPEVSFAEVCAYLAGRLQVIVEYVDGAIYLRPQPTAEPARAGTPAGSTSKPGPAELPEVAESEDAASEPQVTTQPSHAEALPPAITQPSTTPPVPRKTVPLPVDRPSPQARAAPAPASAPAGPPPELIYQADRKKTHRAADEEPDGSPLMPRAKRDRRGTLPGRITLTPAIKDWAGFAKVVEAATGVTCRLPDHPPRYQPVEADGPAGEVLESLHLLGRFDYRVERDGGRGRPVLLIDPPGKP